MKPGLAWFNDTIQWIRGFLTGVDEFLRTTICPTLKSLQTPIDTWLASLPMSVAMGCALGLYCIAVLWVWTLKKKFVFRGAPDANQWRDLRIWATLVVVPYVVVYVLLGR